MLFLNLISSLNYSIKIRIYKRKYKSSKRIISFKMSSLKIILLLCLTVFVTSQNFLEEKNMLGGLEDTLRLLKRSDLEKVAEYCESYDRKQRKLDHIMGGIHDYIEALNNIDLMKIIFGYAKVYTELNDIAFLKKEANVKDDQDYAELDLWLGTLPRKDLIEIALKAEDFSKQGKKTLGGLHDFIFTLDDQDISNIILNFTKNHAELNNKDKLKSFLATTKLTTDQLKTKLKAYEQKSLLHLAYILDSYNQERSMVKRLGGLHDYAHTLNKEQLEKACLTLISRWEELQKEGFLDELLTNSGSRLGGARFGGIEDYLFRMDIQDLKKLALASEDYDRKKRDIVLLGGLHDYIDSLDASDIVNLISDYIKQYPELRNPGTLEELAKIPKGGFAFLVNQLSAEDLKNTCLALEKYDRKARGIHLLGGLHDYIDTLTTEDLTSYIRKMVDVYPLFRDAEELKKLRE